MSFLDYCKRFQKELKRNALCSICSFVRTVEGSKRGSDTGVGFSEARTVFEAEVVAIPTCAQIRVQRNGERNRIYTIIGSQAAIKAVRSAKTKRKLSEKTGAYSGI